MDWRNKHSDVAGPHQQEVIKPEDRTVRDLITACK